MKKYFKITFLCLIIIGCFSSISYAMPKNSDYEDNGVVSATPESEEKQEDPSLQFRWIWVKDNLCIRSKTQERTTKTLLLQKWDLGFVPRWSENDKPKIRDAYSGKWTQSENGIWSFEFDDHTIPVGVTKIDDVLYAFNGYGELQEGYNYWGELKTAADGLVTSDEPEFLAWLATQYVPECTSHE